jgi:hypothetical protein
MGEKFDPRYAGIARRPTIAEIREAYRYSKTLGLKYETITHEKGLADIFI